MYSTSKFVKESLAASEELRMWARTMQTKTESSSLF